MRIPWSKNPVMKGRGKSKSGYTLDKVESPAHQRVIITVKNPEGKFIARVTLTTKEWRKFVQP